MIGKLQLLQLFRISQTTPYCLVTPFAIGTAVLPESLQAAAFYERPTASSGTFGTRLKPVSLAGLKWGVNGRTVVFAYRIVDLATTLN
jgi:hypothetical protein